MQEQFSAEAKRQKQYCDREANAILLEPDNLVLAKTDAFKGKRKVMDQWEDEPYEVVHQVTEASLHTSPRTRRQDAHEFSTETDFPTVPANKGHSPLYGSVS